MGRQPELIPFKYVFVRIARKYILRRLYRAKLLTPKEAHKIASVLRRIDKAILQLTHLRSIVAKVLRKTHNRKFDDLL